MCMISLLDKKTREKAGDIAKMTPLGYGVDKAVKEIKKENEQPKIQTSPTLYGG